MSGFVAMRRLREGVKRDEYIEKYLAEKLDLMATLDAKSAYEEADFVVIAAPMNLYSTKLVVF